MGEFELVTDPPHAKIMLGMLIDSARSSKGMPDIQSDRIRLSRLDREAWLALGMGSAAAVAVLIVFGVVWAGNFGVNDFYKEAWPAYRLLIHGHPVAFAQQGPAYLGSLIIRAPFALVVGLAGGGARAVYLATALPCLLAGVWLGVWWSRQQTFADGKTRVSPIVLCSLNPVVIMAVVLGHPEEVLGATFAVAAIIFAARQDAGWAGVLTGLALINKSWALVIVPVVLVALQDQRPRAIVALLLTAATVLVPVLLLKQAGTANGAAASLGGGTGTIFQTPQLIWWVGRNSLLARDAHYLIVVISIPCALLWRCIHRYRPEPASRLRQALLLLALVMLLRAALDPEDNIYYHVPLLLALMAYEAGRPARITAISTGLLTVLILLQGTFLNVPDNVQAGYYTAIAAVGLVWLGWHLFAPPGRRPPATGHEPVALSGPSRAT